MEFSTAEPQSPPSPQATASEGDFLQQQADEARAALAATLADAAAALKQGIDPVTWARRYPMVAIGSALLAGFAAAAVTVPTKEQQELKKLEKLARALRPAAAPAPTNGSEKSAAPTAAPEPGKSIWMTVLHEVINLLRPALISMLSAYVGSHRAPPDSSNGQPPSAASSDSTQAAA